MSGTPHFRNPVQMNRLKDGKSENHLHNGESATNSNRNEQSEAATFSRSKSHYGQHFEEQKNAKKKGDMTLEDMYNSNYEFEDDEDNDSDWEPALLGRNVLENPKWFCLNCTMHNSGTNIHCDICGEHRESGVVKHGFLAPPFSQAGQTGNELDAIDRLKDLRLKSIAADNTTAIGFDERMLLHEEVEMKSRPHVERPDRLRAIAASLAASGIFPGRCYPISAREITHEELLMVHSSENIEAVELTSHMFSSYFTPDTYANQHSACAARLAAGLCSDLATAICSGSAKNGFALVRPPGHHAGVKQAMGFCLHNNAAIAAFAAQRAGVKKVLIIDWDVHHGNGTQEIFEKNKSVLYISLHRYEDGKFYPGTGAADEVGTMGAEGYCVNVPWSRGGVGDNDYIFAFQQVVIPIASEFDPDFTIISAGFDAARGDPLGCCDVTPTGYGQMTQMCSALSGGKLLVILEGGYNLRSISSSATAVIKVLLGDTPEHDVEQVLPTKAGLRTVLEVLKLQIKYWPLLEPKFFKLQLEWGWYALQDKTVEMVKMTAAEKLAKKKAEFRARREGTGSQAVVEVDAAETVEAVPSPPAPRRCASPSSSRQPASNKSCLDKGKGKEVSLEDIVETLSEVYGAPTKSPLAVSTVVAPSVIDNQPRGIGVSTARRVCLERDTTYLMDYSLSSTFEKGCQWAVQSLQTFHSMHDRNLALEQQNKTYAAKIEELAGAVENITLDYRNQLQKLKSSVDEKVIKKCKAWTLKYHTSPEFRKKLDQAREAGIEEFQSSSEFQQKLDQVRKTTVEEFQSSSKF